MIFEFNKSFRWFTIIFYLRESVVPVIWRRVLGVMFFYDELDELLKHETLATI